MDELAAYRQELLTALMRAVEQIRPLAARLPWHAWHDPLEPGHRQAHHILAHLRALERQEFIPNLKRIQAQEVPTLAIFDDQAWMGAHYQPGEPLNEMMGDLTHLRAEEVEWLRNLPIPDWSRMGRHPWWGLRSLQWWAERQLESSLQHCEQLEAFLTQ